MPPLKERKLKKRPLVSGQCNFLIFWLKGEFLFLIFIFFLFFILANCTDDHQRQSGTADEDQRQTHGLTIHAEDSAAFLFFHIFTFSGRNGLGGLRRNWCTRGGPGCGCGKFCWGSRITDLHQ